MVIVARIIMWDFYVRYIIKETNLAGYDETFGDINNDNARKQILGHLQPTKNHQIFLVGKSPLTI